MYNESAKMEILNRMKNELNAGKKPSPVPIKDLPVSLSTLVSGPPVLAGDVNQRAISTLSKIKRLLWAR